MVVVNTSPWNLPKYPVTRLCGRLVSREYWAVPLIACLRNARVVLSWLAPSSHHITFIQNRLTSPLRAFSLFSVNNPFSAFVSSNERLLLNTLHRNLSYRTTTTNQLKWYFRETSSSLAQRMLWTSSLVSSLLEDGKQLPEGDDSNTSKLTP